MDADHQMEMDFRNAVWELSFYKKAQWTPRNDLLITKRTVSGGIYKVFVSPEACQGIINKQHEILSMMEDVKMGKRPNPTNVTVAEGMEQMPRIIQLSLFNGYPKFGIHILDGVGHIALAKGINLTPAEFEKLLNMLQLLPPTATAPKRPIITVKTFSWSWKLLDNTAPVTYITRGKWYLNSVSCFAEALQDRPEGPYELEMASKTIDIPVDEQLVDAAVGRVILHNIDLTKGYELMQNRMPSDDEDSQDSDLAFYGKSAFRETSMRHVYKLIDDLIETSENATAVLKSAAMIEVARRGKVASQLELLKRDGNTMQYLDIFNQLSI